MDVVKLFYKKHCKGYRVAVFCYVGYRLVYRLQIMFDFLFRALFDFFSHLAWFQ
jgi:hypothetical protein